MFAGENAPLVMAEVELANADEDFDRPDWAGQDVSEDARYFNVNLARDPYSHWSIAALSAANSPNCARSLDLREIPRRCGDSPERGERAPQRSCS